MKLRFHGYGDREKHLLEAGSHLSPNTSGAMANAPSPGPWKTPSLKDTMSEMISPNILYFGNPVALISSLNEDGTPNVTRSFYFGR
jgi:hypothetical protein